MMAINISRSMFFALIILYVEVNILPKHFSTSVEFKWFLYVLKSWRGHVCNGHCLIDEVLLVFELKMPSTRSWNQCALFKNFQMAPQIFLEAIGVIEYKFRALKVLLKMTLITFWQWERTVSWCLKSGQQSRKMPINTTELTEIKLNRGDN